MIGLGKREFRDLNRYQAKMGDIQDLVVIQRGLEAFLKYNEDSAAKLHSFSAHLSRHLEVALRRFRKWADSWRAVEIILSDRRDQMIGLRKTNHPILTSSGIAGSVVDQSNGRRGPLAKVTGSQVAHVAELADALDSGSSE